MKQFLLSLLVLLSFSGVGQIVRPNPTSGFQQWGTATTMSRFNGVVYPVVGYIPALYSDTTSANGTYIKNVPMAHIATNDGKNWVRNISADTWLEEINSGDYSAWKINGNTGIDTTNFIGTIDSVPFIIRTHNQFSGTVGSYITGYDNSVITTGNFPYRHGLISLGIGAAKSLPLNNTGGIVVIGTDALKNLHNSSVSNNYAANGLVVIGTNAYKYLDSSFYPYGNRSTVIGHWAGHRNFAGEYNTIVGAMNMELNYRGSNNTSIGFSTLRSNIDGGGNVAMGLFSMLYNSTGIDTIPLISGGSGYTYANVTISAPLAGSPGGYVQTATATADVSGGAVTAIRMTNKGAGYSIYPHTYDFGTQGNIVVTITGDGTGATAGTPVMISGNDNTCIGTGSGFYNIRGKGNVNVGNSSSNKTDDNYTTLVGFGTSTNSPSGKISKAGAIGYNAKVGASNSLVLGGTGADTVNVGIDVEKPLARLHIASGNIVAQGTTEAYPSTHYLPFSGIGARFMWVNSKRAIRAGYVTDNKWDIDSIAHGSVAFGYYTGAMGYGSLAQGEYAYARGKAALAVGWQVAANADFSVALGAGNKCYGSWSTSFGLNNIANSNISLATGYGTIAYDGASTFGNGTRGKGVYSFATGIGNYSKNYGGAAFGTYNDTTDVGSISAIDNANRIFVVGNGTADNARSNALTILQTGKVGIGTTSPDSLLTVSQGIYGQRGLRLPNLPTGKKAKQLYWDTDGTVYVADSTVGGGGGGGGLTIGTTTIANSATGSILYDSSGILSRNADLYWDVSNKRLGIGTSTPATKFHTVGTVRHQTLGTAITDTTTYKPLVINSSGDVLPSTYWYGGGGGSPAGSNKELQFNNSGSFGGTTGIKYGNATNERLSIWQQSSSDVPLTIRTAGDNSKAAIEIKDTTNQPYTSAIKFTPSAGGNPQPSKIYQGYDGLYIDGGTAPYVSAEGSIVVFGNSTGSVAPFKIHTYPYDVPASPNNWVAKIRTSKTSAVGLAIDWGAVGQTGDLLQFRNNSNTVMARFDSIGKLGVNTVPVSYVDANGSLGAAITTTSSNITLDATHHTVIITSGTPTITLPAAASSNARRIYVVVNQTGSAVTISSYQNFSGSGTTTVAANSSIQIQSDGSNWYRIL